MKTSAIIVAGGSGSRYQSNIPKQFTKINDKMVLDYTLEKFTPLVDHIVIVVHQDYYDFVSNHYSSFSNISICFGGISRQHSVLNGLKALIPANPNFVAIHDGVRLLVSKKMIETSFIVAQKYQSAVPILPITDSLWFLNTDQSLSIHQQRELFVTSQTPQTFEFTTILKVHQEQEASLATFSDCASVYSKLYSKVYTYPGEKTNIKLTDQKDFDFIQYLLNKD